MNARVDSLREEISSLVEARSDSIDALKDQASELEDSSAEAPVAQRRQLQHRADSVRAVMRAMVDRMKAEETRLHALDEVAGLSSAQRDSLARLGNVLSDSIRRMVARELQKAQVEVQRARQSSRREPAVTVEAPTPGVTPARPR
jgi:hypothetical protein